jgi:hypothetical protein
MFGIIEKTHSLALVTPRSLPAKILLPNITDYPFGPIPVLDTTNGHPRTQIISGGHLGRRLLVRFANLVFA